jgi:hypothetical protein
VEVTRKPNTEELSFLTTHADPEPDAASV